MLYTLFYSSFISVFSFILLAIQFVFPVHPLKATCVSLNFIGFLKEDGCIVTTKHLKFAPAIEMPLSIGCVELAWLDMLSNETSRAFSVTNLNEAVFPLGEPMN